jgi:SAM-dependent methyltransferase
MNAQTEVYGYNDARGGTPHAKYLRFAQAAVGLQGKSVLEVGGCTPPAAIVGYRPARWDSANLDSKAVESFNVQAAAVGLNGAAAVQDASQFDMGRKYDVVYSINAFEHIKPLPRAIGCMRDALAPGGKLFSLFGPIWSGDVGHHLSVMTEAGELHFNDGVLAPWEHLTSTPEQMHVRLEKKYGKAPADRVVEFVYRFPDLNRVYEHEFLDIFAKSGLRSILTLRNKTNKKPPAVFGASATRELMVVLKNGRPGLLERPATLARFAFAFARERMKR